MACMVMGGISANSSARLLRSAAPVGVIISPGMSPAKTGTPSSSSAVAGAGTGSTPCAHFTVP